MKNLEGEISKEQKACEDCIFCDINIFDENFFCGHIDKFIDDAPDESPSCKHYINRCDAIHFIKENKSKIKMLDHE